MYSACYWCSNLCFTADVGTITQRGVSVDLFNIINCSWHYKTTYVCAYLTSRQVVFGSNRSPGMWRHGHHY